MREGVVIYVDVLKCGAINTYSLTPKQFETQKKKYYYSFKNENCQGCKHINKKEGGCIPIHIMSFKNWIRLEKLEKINKHAIRRDKTKT